MKQIGKIGKLNIKSNKILKKMFDEKDIRTCEIKLDGCDGSYCLNFCHRHKRVWYRTRPALLYKYNQVILGCQKCHTKIEYDSLLTTEIFDNLRGVEWTR